MSSFQVFSHYIHEPALYQWNSLSKGCKSQRMKKKKKKCITTAWKIWQLPTLVSFSSTVISHWNFYSDKWKSNCQYFNWACIKNTIIFTYHVPYMLPYRRLVLLFCLVLKGNSTLNMLRVTLADVKSVPVFLFFPLETRLDIYLRCVLSQSECKVSISFQGTIKKLTKKWNLQI